MYSVAAPPRETWGTLMSPALSSLSVTTEASSVARESLTDETLPQRLLPPHLTVDENRSPSSIYIRITHTPKLKHNPEHNLNLEHIRKRLSPNLPKQITLPHAIQLHRRLRRRHPLGRRLSRNALLRHLPRPIPNLRPRALRVSRQRVFSEIHVRSIAAMPRLRRGDLYEK
ncbi:hypothetical protein CCMA1212_008853 [Trichoderma ghanense]|uniref:Uncharacterized protein n=1 Tax=Trichoderma ghanense TaxID=65468 RepID=A0ABY2GUX6_9HYPO